METRISLSLSEIVDATQNGKLRSWRVRTGLSRTRLAKLLGMSEKSFRHLEMLGRPTKRFYETVIALYKNSDSNPSTTTKKDIVNLWYEKNP